MRTPHHVNRPATTQVAWKTGVSGAWDDGALWSTGAVPDAADAVTIAAAGTYAVTITGSAAAAASITLNDASATLAVDALLALTGDLTVDAGTLGLGAAGTISGGTLIAAAGSRFALDNGGTLLGTNLQGTITLDQANGSLTLGAGPAAGSHDTIALQGAGETLTFNGNGNRMLLGTTLAVASAPAAQTADAIELGMPASAETFTIAAGSAIDAAGDIYIAGGIGNAPSNITLVNDGVLSAASGGTLGIGTPPFGRDGVAFFSNAGQISIGGGATFLVAASMANSGTISVTGANSTLAVGLLGNVTNPNDTLTNTGRIEVSSGGTINLLGTESAATLNSIINQGGTVIVSDTVNGPGTITVPTLASGGTLALNAADVSNVTIIDPTGSLAFLAYDTASFTNVSYHGTLNITGQDGVSVSDGGGATFAGANGTGAGTVEFGALGGTLSADGTLSNVAINLSNGIVAAGNSQAQTAALVLGATCDVTLNGGATGRIQDDSAGGPIVNQGTISVSGASTRLNVDANFDLSASATATAFINAGELTITDDASVIFPNNAPAPGTAGLGNTGTIDVTTGGTLQSGNAGFAALTNAGTMTADGAGSLIGWGIYGSASNTGSIGISNGATLVLGSDWTNTGIITVTTGSTVNFGGTFTAASLMSVSVSDAAEIISGTLTNTVGSVISANDASSVTLAQGADIIGGTIIGANGTLSVASYTFLDYNAAPELQGVTIEGTLALTQANATLAVGGGLALEGANGRGAGAIAVTGANATLELNDSETLNNATITIGSATGSAALFLDNTAEPNATLTFGTSLHVVGEGNASIGSGLGYDGCALVNDGTITAAHGLLTLTATAGAFTNAGTLMADAGAGFDAGGFGFEFTDSGLVSASGANASISLDFGVSTITGSVILSDDALIYLGMLSNGESRTLTGGAYTAVSGGTIAINNTIGIDAADITLGAGGTFGALAAGGAVVALDATRVSIAADGTLTLKNGAIFDATAGGGKFTDSGSLNLQGATFKAHLLTIEKGGELTGTGAVNASTVNLGAVRINSGTLSFLGAFDNAGTLTASGGTTTLGHLTGAGAVDLGGATLIAHAAASAQTVDFTTDSGLLDLADPAAFLAAIANFGAGDRIDLLGTAATKLTYANDTLTVLNGSTAVATLHFSTSESLSDFGLSSDGAGGSLISFV